MCSSSTSPQWEHDVFVSFRGEDERDRFISHLRHWLEENGFSYFYDKDAEHAGKKIKDKIFPAIRHARVALVVLSKNYANSTWCLNELVEILKCNSELKNHKLVVIPIFYDVDPADVKHLTTKSDFGKAFHGLCEKVENVEQKQIWKNALAEVKEFSGFKTKDFGGEKELLGAIFQSLYKLIYPHSLDFVRNAIGAKRLANDVIPLLRIDKKDVRMIGISGTEGIGKTMVAGAVCNGALKNFEHTIFLDKVGEAKHSDRVSLQQKLIGNLVKVNEWTMYRDFHGNIKLIKSNLCRKKILLVLDGVTNKEQMDYFGAENRKSFCPGSRILITTSNRNLLNDLEVDDKYIVEGLNRDEAFRLFCRHAFDSEEPQQGYEESSRYLAHYAGGHPLALEKWGSFLNERSKDEWQKLSDQLVESRDLNSLFWSSTKKKKFFWGSNNLNSIGADFRGIFKEYPFRVVGPWGTGTWQDEGYTDVWEIVVGLDSEGIKFITIEYKKGRRRKAVTLGTEGGATSRRNIKLKCPSEYLTSISGHTKEVSRRTILQSLTFHTNRRKPERIGTKNDGRKFSFPYTGGKIIGFHGSCNDSHLESIGAFYNPIPHTPIDYSGRVFGPFGGASEKLWDSDDINGISVRYADFISKITFKVNDDTNSKPQTTYGGNGRKGHFKVVKLENSSEYITSFSGYFENANGGRILINSLTFRTNKRILGPIGREKGTHFSSPSEAVKVSRFFGRTVDYLESIGAQVERCYPFKSVGLFGSSNASNWDDRDDHTHVRKILFEIEPGDGIFIRSITFFYEKNGKQFSPGRHGGPKGEDVDPIKIDADEYLTSMSGYYTNAGITSLTFRTNRKMIGPIGKEKGMHFSSPAMGGKIVGFYGRSGKNLEAIGAYFEPISDLYSVKSIGPFGGSSGNPWDDRKFKGVREIEVKHRIDVSCIKFVYDDGSKQGHTVMYGSDIKGGLSKVTPVKLNYPREYLTSISGYVRENGAIQSLTFYSNKSRYGPCGKEMGKYFWYPSIGSRIIGFHGTCGKTLNSIGVHAELIPHMCPFKTVGPFGSSKGTPWDDGVHTDVRGFRISFSSCAIEAIGIAYDNNGSFVSASEHGTGYDNEGSFVFGLEPGDEAKDKYTEVLLDYPKERLRCIWVWMDEDGNAGQYSVRDLQIVTTYKNQTYGPFIPTTPSKGNKLKRFRIPSEEDGGRIVGFFGKAQKFLNSIGARLEPY